VEDQVKSMAYRQPIIDRLDRQTAKGIAKYGGPIDKSGHLTSAEEALEYLAEELTDGLVYVEHVKALVLQQAEENQRLQSELEEYTKANWAAQGREAKLAEALRWYADLKHHGHAPGRIEILHDQGQRARDTLKELGYGKSDAE
jgi:hypothetical protein